ncbi:MAG: DNA-binding domain-containing protein, partial [Candidatus Competibacter sp.]
MRLAELQTRMRQTLLAGGSDPELLALLDDPPEQRERRLAVYRNNVRHSLLSMLDATFPVIRELIGADCFTAATLMFVVQRPPRAPALYAYGGELPDFLADFAPLAELPWLADVARLEWARNEALFAVDREPLSPN